MRPRGATLLLAAAVVAALSCASSAPADGAVPAMPTPLTGEFTLTPTASSSTVVLGSTVTVTVAFANTGTAELGAPTVSASYTPAVAEVASAFVTGGGCSPEITCTFATVAAGGRVDLVIVLKAIAMGTINVDLSARAAYTPIPGVHFNRSHTAHTTIVVTPRVADLDVRLTSPTAKPKVGKLLKAVAIVANHGASDAPAATVDFTVPAGFRLVGISSPQGSCTASSRRCTFAVLGASASARVVLSLMPSRTGARAIVARVGSGTSVDPSGANNVDRLVLAPQAPAAARHTG